MLIDFQDLFKGQRGQYNGEPIELELLPGSKPFYAKPFSIPKAFIIPKKNKTVRVITDFRGLNKCLKRNPWGLYQYNTLPMGITPATNIFQQRMSAIFFDMPVVVIYMDDTIVFGYADLGSHLGFLNTRDGIKPQPDKIQGIINMQ